MLGGMTSALKADVRPRMKVFLSYTFVKDAANWSFSSYSKNALSIPFCSRNASVMVGL